MQTVWCATVAALLTVSLQLACVDAVPSSAAHSLLHRLRQKKVTAEESASQFFGASCAAAFVGSPAWVLQATNAGVQTENRIVEIDNILNSAHSDLIKAQICGLKYAEDLANPDNSGGHMIVLARANLWTQLILCVRQYITARTALLAGAPVATLNNARWAIEPASNVQNTLVSQMYTKREWQRAYGGGGVAVECSTSGANNLPACITQICTRYTSPPNCVWAGNQVLVEWVPVGGTQLRAIWAPKGFRIPGHFNAPFDSREADSNSATIGMANNAQLPTNTGLPSAFVKWDMSKCTYTISPVGARTMFTSPVNGCGVFVAEDPNTGLVMMIHANANDIAGVGPYANTNAHAKNVCANQILVNHNAVYNTAFAKQVKMTEAQYVTANSKRVSIYGVKGAAPNAPWQWNVVRIATNGAVTHPVFVPWV